MGNKYLISIIIPVYNVGKYLEEAMESIKRQTIGFENLQVILADDMSTDNSRNLIEQYDRLYENVVAIYLTYNSGAAGRPRNEALKLVDAPYIMFLDPDDIYTDNACEVLLNEIRKDGVDTVNGYYEEMAESGELIIENVWEDIELSGDIVSLPDQMDQIIKVQGGWWARIYRREIIENNNIYFPEGIPGQDSYFLYKYLLNAKTSKYIEKPIVLYRQRNKDNKSISYNNDCKFFKNLEQCFRMIFELFKEKNRESMFQIILRTSIEFYTVKMIDSDLSLEDCVSVLNRWKWLYEYADTHQVEKGNYTEFIIEDVKVGKIVDAAVKLKKLRNIRRREKELIDGSLWLKTQWKSCEKSAKWLNNQVKNYKEGNTWLKQQYDNYVKENDELKAMQRSLKQQNKEMCKHLDACRADIEMKRAHSVTRDEENAWLKEQLANYRKENEWLKEQVANYQKENAWLKEKDANHQQANDWFKEQVVNYQKQNEWLKEQVANYQKENVWLKGKVTNYQKENA